MFGKNFITLKYIIIFINKSPKYTTYILLMTQD